MAILHIQTEFGSPNYRTWRPYTSPGMTHPLKVHSQLLNVHLNVNKKCRVVTCTKYFFTATIQTMIFRAEGPSAGREKINCLSK